MINLDHINLVGRNLYESTYRLSQETGLGNFDGFFFPNDGIANKILPLGGDVYIEVESIVDPYKITPDNKILTYFYQAASQGDVFFGLCLRADTLDELQEIATYHNTTVRGVEGGKLVAGLAGTHTAQRMNRTTGLSAQAPYAMDAWPLGRPNVYIYGDMSTHPSRLPPEPGSGSVTPKGVKWIEVGGAEADMKKWLGPVPLEPLKMRFNGEYPGLYAVGIETDSGEIVIRKNPVTSVVRP